MSTMDQEPINEVEPSMPAQDKQVSTKLLGDYSVVEQAESSVPRFDTDMPPSRVVIDILHSGVQIIFDLSESTILGRSYPKSKNLFSGIDLASFDGYEKGVSHEHALFIREHGHIVVRDLDSRNGTLINGKRLEAGKNYILKSGDLVHLGSFAIRLRFLYRPHPISIDQAEE